MLKRCLIFTCLSDKNVCKSFHGSDNRDYTNELCFEEGTKASHELSRLIEIPDNALIADEKKLIDEYKSILEYIKNECTKTKHPEYKDFFYNPNYKYGLAQIKDEIDVEDVIETDKNGKEIKVRRYGDLHNRIINLQKSVNEYYRKYLACDKTGILFNYSLIK